MRERLLAERQQPKPQHPNRYAYKKGFRFCLCNTLKPRGCDKQSLSRTVLESKQNFAKTKPIFKGAYYLILP
jgi:hypothetical protein